MPKGNGYFGYLEVRYIEKILVFVYLLSSQKQMKNKFVPPCPLIFQRFPDLFRPRDKVESESRS